ncbi:YhhN-like protein [Novosphingobium nitrogenifigens DSM 19370]|uniref:YhhN-like protein n=1 Tax=Novosphingobium nitrogenifigens DSM 19370 TaxID=983920 RepID=F1ZA01_9SPHN|nr:lysoplasmalogenase family protein [Novosphingobium nitrogenifigens]EGD58591.1 YhhN-like protein [Novosphingobium nitrogenifigens DSM 19370]
MAGGSRVWLVASLICGLGYWYAHAILSPGMALLVLKGGGVGALAIYAGIRAEPDDRPIAVVLALGAVGDMLIEVNLVAGALAFLAGHWLAVWFYLRHPRAGRGLNVMPLVMVLIPLMGWKLSRMPVTAIYSVGLAAMAGSAWASGFPRSRVALGAILFVTSDLLLFGRMGLLAGSPWTGDLIWPTYYFGQVLIALGVVGL